MTLRDRFDSGMFLDQFVEQADENHALWVAAARRAEAASAVIERLRRLTVRRYLLVIAEDWCPDALGTVPPLARLAQMVPQLELRIIRRDENLDVMDAHLTRGGRAIPVVIVLDEGFRELSWWGSRPIPLQRWVLSPEGQALSKADRYREIRRWYSSDRGQTALEEIATLIERTAATEPVA